MDVSHQRHKTVEDNKGKIPYKAIFTVIVLVLVATFLIRPSVIGYGIYQDVQKSNYDLETYGQNIQELRQELESSKTNNSLYGTFNEQLLTQYNDVSKKYTTCIEEKSQAEAQVTASQSSCNEKTFALQSQLATTKDLYDQSLQDKEEQQQDTVERKTSELQDDKEQCTQEMNTLQQQKDTVQKDFDAFASTMAKSICCKEKVDNPSINSYTISNNKIICLSNGEKNVVC